VKTRITEAMEGEVQRVALLSPNRRPTPQVHH